MKMLYVGAGLLFVAGTFMTIGALALGPDAFSAGEGLIILAAGAVSLLQRRWASILAAVVAALGAALLMMLQFGLGEEAQTRFSELMVGVPGWAAIVVLVAGAALSLAGLREPPLRAAAPGVPPRMIP